MLLDPDQLALNVENVMIVKKITEQKHPIFRPRFTECVERIRAYVKLQKELELLRTQKYVESKNASQLIQLWKTLKPDEPLENRFTRQWGDIGFQGEDPATDFRGMGMLGFENLVYFSEKHTDLARQTLVHSNHPKYGYFFAIVGINLTDLCYRFLSKGLLKSHFYNLDSKHFTIADFHEVYCYVFVEFDKFWMLEKPHILQFNEIREKFEKKLTQSLKSPSVLLTLTSDRSHLITQEI